MNKKICKKLSINVSSLAEMTDEEREEYEAEVHRLSIENPNDEDTTDSE